MINDCNVRWQKKSVILKTRTLVISADLDYPHSSHIFILPVKIPGYCTRNTHKCSERYKEALSSCLCFMRFEEQYSDEIFGFPHIFDGVQRSLQSYITNRNQQEQQQEKQNLNNVLVN